MKDFRVDQEVKYRDVYKGLEVTGFIHCIVEIVDHEDKEKIGKKVAYVRKERGYCSDKVFIEDLELVEE
jgi:hypothetical protein